MRTVCLAFTVFLAACGAHNEAAWQATIGGGGDAGNDAGANSPDGGGPVHVVGACNGLGAVGAWENITPSDMVLKSPYTGALVALPDPVHAGTVYVTSSQNGVFKSTDCGATWTKTNTGRNGSQLDSGNIWSAQIDPMAPDTLYALTGYGPAGLWKSTNDGVDWDQILPMDMGMPGFVGRVSMDPTSHLHLLLTFHNNCTNGHTPVCFGETKDGGKTWNIVDFPTSIKSQWGEGTFLLPIDATHWIYENWDIYYTPDAGATWTLVTPGGTGAAGAIQGPFFRTLDGTLFVTGQFGVLSSPDGSAWSKIPSSATNCDAITGDGERLFAVTGFQAPGGSQFAFAAAYNNVGSWSVLPTPGLPSQPSSGANSVAYDPDHHILYSAIQGMGLWRTVTQASSGPVADASVQDAPTDATGNDP